MQLVDVGEDRTQAIVIPSAVEAQDNALHDNSPNALAGPQLRRGAANRDPSAKEGCVACDSATATVIGARLPNRVSGVASGFPSRKAAGYWVNTIRQGLTEGQSWKATNQRFLSRYGQNHTAAGLWLTQKISRAHQLRQLSGVQLS